jgi:anti-anti-sigma regulatory factor
MGCVPRRRRNSFIAHAEAVVIAYASRTENTYRIELDGNPDLSYRRRLRKEVESALGRGDRRVVVDCASWSHLDLIVLSALVNCAKACDEEGAEFELENLDGCMRSRIVALSLGHRLGLT